jgi:hypothetical protein
MKGATIEGWSLSPSSEGFVLVPADNLHTPCRATRSQKPDLPPMGCPQNRTHSVQELKDDATQPEPSAVDACLAEDCGQLHHHDAPSLSMPLLRLVPPPAFDPSKKEPSLRLHARRLLPEDLRRSRDLPVLRRARGHWGALLHGSVLRINPPSPEWGSGHSVAVGHPEVGHSVEYPARQLYFNSLSVEGSASHFSTDDRLVSEDGILHQTARAVA